MFKDNYYLYNNVTKLFTQKKKASDLPCKAAAHISQVSTGYGPRNQTPLALLVVSPSNAHSQVAMERKVKQR